MNKIYILICILFSLNIQAQQLQWEKVIQKGWEHEILSQFQLNNGKVVLHALTHASGLIVKNNELIYIDWDGTYSDSAYWFVERWTKLRPINNEPEKLIGVGNSDYICAMDFIPPWGYWDFNILNADTKELLNQADPRQYYSEHNLFIDYTEYPFCDGAFMSSTGSWIAIGDTMFQRVHGYEFECRAYLDTLTTSLISLFPFQEDLGLAFSKQAIYTLDTNANLSEINAYNFSIDSVTTTYSDSTYLLICSDSFRICNQTGIILDQLVRTDLMDSIYQVSYKGNQFWVLGELNNVLVLNTYENGVAINSYPLDTSKAQFIRFALNPTNEQFMLIGYESAVINKHLLLQVYDMNAPEIEKSNENIALTAIEFQSVVPWHCGNPSPYPVYFYGLEYLVSIENRSDSTLQSCYINSQWTPSFAATIICNQYCYDEQKAVYLSNLNLAPDSSTTISFEFIVSGVLTPLPICFWTSTPNGQPDRDPSDDQICFDIPLGLNELNTEQTNINVYPNPSKDLTHFYFPENWPTIQLTYRISDLAGRIIETNICHGSQFDYSTTHLPEGLYWVSFKTDDGKTANVPLMVIK
ncbi:MAG TPA: T9SS type A sorting domain-containing protein [Flavobacteriales bacterium]|nr:T9SS type A sorting domain-containing protein [Flavobacteriales bacterium]